MADNTTTTGPDPYATVKDPFAMSGLSPEPAARGGYETSGHYGGYQPQPVADIQYDDPDDFDFDSDE